MAAASTRNLLDVVEADDTAFFVIPLHVNSCVAKRHTLLTKLRSSHIKHGLCARSQIFFACLVGSGRPGNAVAHTHFTYTRAHLLFSHIKILNVYQICIHREGLSYDLSGPPALFALAHFVHRS
jgi:hypothetical protein